MCLLFLQLIAYSQSSPISVSSTYGHVLCVTVDHAANIHSEELLTYTVQFTLPMSAMSADSSINIHFEYPHNAVLVNVVHPTRMVSSELQEQLLLLILFLQIF